METKLREQVIYIICSGLQTTFSQLEEEENCDDIWTIYNFISTLNNLHNRNGSSVNYI